MTWQTWLRIAATLVLTLVGEIPNARAQTSKSKTRNAEVKVLPAETPGSKPSSEFLQKPGSDRYDPNANDWRDIPPWKQTSFFGIRAKGQLFIYVVDCSGSMLEEDRLIRAKRELRRSVLSLQHPQRFKVVFYNDQVVPMPGDLPRSADLASKSQMVQWLRLIEPDGETDPRGAMSLALSLRPDAVFLLSDGEFPEGTVEAIACKNGRKIPIHCVDLSSGAGGDQLQQIARDSGGQYRWRPQVDGP